MSFSNGRRSVQSSNRTAFQSHANEGSHQPNKRLRTVFATSTGATTSESTLEVYSPGFRGILVIPRRHVFHTPAPELCVTRLVLCSNFRPEDPMHSCSMGSRCKFVHADTSRALEHDVHVNYAWRSIEDVTYSCYSASEGMLDIAPPNGTVADVSIPAEYILKTNALNSTRRPLSHCAHYFYNRACNRGSECNFIHAVYIDPEARDHQRAPVPSQLNARIPRPPTRQTYYDRTEDVLVEKPQRHHRKMMGSSSSQQQHQQGGKSCDECCCCRPGTGCFCICVTSTVSDDHSSSGTLHDSSDFVSSNSDVSTPREAAVGDSIEATPTSRSTMRFHYNPYSMTAPLTMLAA